MSFYAYLNRMRYIERWSLMRNTSRENILEHSAQVAQFAHALAIIKNKFFGGSVDCDRVACVALYHELSEVVTGDLPTPIKYYNMEINSAYKSIESTATEKLLSLLPEELRGEYRAYAMPDKDAYEYKLVKAGDKLAAYVKCAEEICSGNADFARAKQSLLSELKKLADSMPELRYFMENFLSSFELPLDDLQI